MSPTVPVITWLLAASQLAFAGDPALGRATYVAKCQACHGATGRGDGPASAALPKPPRSFANPDFWVGLTNEKLGATISSGKPATAMRGFPMEPAQMADLIAYLRDFQPKNP